MSLFIYSLNFKIIILVVALMQRFKNYHFCWFCMGNGCALSGSVHWLWNYVNFCNTHKSMSSIKVLVATHRQDETMFNDIMRLEMLLANWG